MPHVNHVPNYSKRWALTILLGRLKSLFICWFTYTMKAASSACMITGRRMAIQVQYLDLMTKLPGVKRTAMNWAFGKPQNERPSVKKLAWEFWKVGRAEEERMTQTFGLSFANCCWGGKCVDADAVYDYDDPSHFVQISQSAGKRAWRTKQASQMIIAYCEACNKHWGTEN